MIISKIRLNQEWLCYWQKIVVIFCLVIYAGLNFTQLHINDVEDPRISG